MAAQAIHRSMEIAKQTDTYPKCSVKNILESVYFIENAFLQDQFRNESISVWS